MGSRVLHQWQGRAELFTFPRGSLAAADESAIRRFAETVPPDVILHLAALSDTGYCQQHPEESRRANVELPVWMAKAARDTEINFLLIVKLPLRPESEGFSYPICGHQFP